MIVDDAPRIDSTERVPCAPYRALVFYGKPDATLALMSHPIDGGVFGDGVPVSPADLLNELMTDRTCSTSSVSLLPGNLLQVRGPTRFAWYTKAHERPMWFRQREGRPLRVRWPALLWHLDDKRLFVYALASNRRPTSTSRVYHAPLMNIADNGLVCLGTATLPADLGWHNLAGIESCIFDSYFTHVNCGNTVRGAGRDNDAHIAFWEQKADAHAPVYARDMIPFGPLSTALRSA